MQIQHQEFSFHLTVHPCDCRLPILGSWKLLPDLCVWSIIPFDFFLVLVSDQAFGIFMLQCLDHFAWQCSIPLPFWCFSCCHLRVHPWLQETLACSPAVRAARTWVCSLTPWLSVKFWNQFDEWLRMGPIQKCYGTRLLWATDFDLHKPSEVGAP